MNLNYKGEMIHSLIIWLKEYKRAIIKDDKEKSGIADHYTLWNKEEIDRSEVEMLYKQ